MIKKHFQFLFLFIFLCFSSSSFSQFEKFAAGLSFSSGIDYNTTETGNPGLFAESWLSLGKKTRIAPSLTAFLPKTRNIQVLKVTNYMFQADMDVEYLLVKERDINLWALTGMNVTGIYSKYTEILPVNTEPLESKSGLKPGINLGLSLGMIVNKFFDGILTAKYVAGPWDQLIIHAGVCYYFTPKRRKGW